MTRKVIDWEAVEIEYRAGIRSLKDIGGQFGVSDAAIIKRAKRDSWVRDLKAKIHARAEAKVSAAVVSAEVSARTRLNERETIEKVSDELVSVRLAQRKDIQRTRAITMSLLAELEEQACRDTKDMLEEIAATLRENQEEGRDDLDDVKDLLQEIYTKVRSLPTKAKVLKDLGDSLRVLVALERQAFGLDEKDNAPVDPLTTLLHTIAKNNGNGIKPVALDPEHEDDDEADA